MTDLSKIAQRMKHICYFAIAIALVSCSSPDSKYQDACKLIGEMKFEEARDALAGVEKEQIKKGDPTVAMHLCEAGLLADANKFDEAYGKMRETDDNSRYKVVIAADDPLHNPALNLALLIKAKSNEPRIKEIMEVDPETETYGNFFAELWPSGYAEEVLSYELPEYDKDESYEGGDFSLPRMMYASFGNVKLAASYASALEGVEERYREYLIKLEADAKVQWAWYETQQDQRLEEEELNAQFALNGWSEIETFLLGSQPISVFHSQWYEVRGKEIRTVLRFGHDRAGRTTMLMILVAKPINGRVGSVEEEVIEKWRRIGRSVTLTFRSGEEFTFERTGTHSFTSEVWDFNRTADPYNYAM